MNVQAVILAGVSPERMRSAERAWQSYEEFVAEYGLVIGEASTVLFLTSHSLVEGITGQSLRRKLALLDLAAETQARTKPSDQPLVREFLKGVHKRIPLDARPTTSDPLYFGHVRMLAKEAVKPTLRQLRAHAFVLTVNATGMHMAEALRVGTSDIRFTPTGMRVTIQRSRTARRVDFFIPSADDVLLCPVRAMRRLIAATPPGSRPLFSAVRGGLNDGLRDHLRAIGAVALRIPPHGDAWCNDTAILLRVSREILRPRPVALRDRALLLIAHLAALNNEDVIDLRATDVRTSTNGLILSLPSRRSGIVAIPRGADASTCAVKAWREWEECRRALPGCRETGLAFPRLDPGFRGAPVDPDRLTTLVAAHCERARLEGHFTFTSLRFGFIRSALREGATKHEIAIQAGLLGPSSLQRHEDRENLLTGNIALLTGL